jgi:FG-GAP-like repeat
VTTADVNGDNKIDVIVANEGSNTVSVLLNTGNGTFINQMTYSTGSNPFSVTTADVNGDNKTDVIVANFNSNSVGICLSVVESGKLVKDPSERIELMSVVYLRFVVVIERLRSA